MIEPIGRAAAAYAGQTATVAPALKSTPAAAASPSGATSATDGSPEADFGAFLDRQAAQAVETLKEGERVSVAAVAGKAGAQDVVRSVLAAEMTVQTVVAIRDRMVQAYQEIMRMTV